MSDHIRVKGARQHNLKGIDVEIESGKLTVITGPSGSGKSSLAFDTIYAEGQRRYIESLSTYAKQFLRRMPKPLVDQVEGVSPSVSIDQRNQVQSSRSTIGTITEVYDYMRLLWSRVGTTVCPTCETPVIPDTVTSATDVLRQLGIGAQIVVGFPFRISTNITSTMAVVNLQSKGYLRVIADGKEIYLPELETAVHAGDEKPEETKGMAESDACRELTDSTELIVVVDRLVLSSENRERLADSLSLAFVEGRGRAIAFDHSSEKPPVQYVFEESHRCGTCEQSFPETTPSLFSFNSPAGACDACTGFGAILEYSRDLIVPDSSRSLEDGALDPWSKPRYTRERSNLAAFAQSTGLDPLALWDDLPKEAKDVLIKGGIYRGERFVGVIPFLRSKEKKRYKPYIRVFLRQYQLPRLCQECGGTKLKLDALNVRIAGNHIAEIAALPIAEVGQWLRGDLKLSSFARKIAQTISSELEDRIQFLEDVGLGYLPLDRQARTLSGGEMQRIRLASCLGSRLIDTLYVLDEPTIGLHASDIAAFTGVLQRLAERGNTVLVVEHDSTVLRRADRIIELGPQAGEKGGEIVFEGDWDKLLLADTSTGLALAERHRPSNIDSSSLSVHPTLGGSDLASKGKLVLRGAKLHNVQDVDLEIPLGLLTVVTGVSGSGKSTLIRGVLFHALEQELAASSSVKRHLGEPEGSYHALQGAGVLEGVVLVDQQPIGRTSRSNPATYIGAFKALRDMYARLPESKERRFGPGHFSFNRSGGRCEHCKGTGEETVEMVFLADVSVPCEVCDGARYRPEVLDVEYRGYSILDALNMTVNQAIRFFVREDRLGERLWHLQRVGLGYLKLGQSATTLSGGEAQRLKIARELSRRGRGGRRVYILDEPTVGLGVGEVKTLTAVLRELVSEGHTVIVIEHNLDVISDADWIVDLGPGAAMEGGRIVAVGPPLEILKVAASKTGAHLSLHLEGFDRQGPLAAENFSR